MPESSNEFDFSLRESLNSVKGQVDLLFLGALDDVTEEEEISFLKELKSNTDNLYELLNSSIVEKANEIKDKNKIIEKLLKKAQFEKDKSDTLLLNMLPKEIVEELKTKGYSKTRKIDLSTVLFTDFVGFTNISESLTPEELINELEASFDYFDEICGKYNLEKLKTIGDSYMLAGGIPSTNKSNPVDVCLGALQMQKYMLNTQEIKKKMGLPFWEIRIGIHSGPLVAGIIGKHKLLYDIWGDTVNTASRMESSGEPGKINISKNTYNYVKDFFDCEFRGKVKAKRKGELDMYFLMGIKDELSENKDKITPNSKFKNLYINRFSMSSGTSLFSEESNLRFYNLHQNAISYLKNGSYHEALQIFLQLHSMDPNNVAMLNNLGVIYSKLGKYQKAKETFKSALKLADEDYINNIEHNINIIEQKSIKE